MINLFPWIAAGLLIGALISPAEAHGRRPPSDEGFPDYNRLELHPKGPDIVPDKPRDPPVPRAALPISTISLPSDVDAAPRPPPKAIPSTDGSEPTMTDDMLSTLVPATTNQK